MPMKQQKETKKFPWGKIISLLLVLLAMNEDVFIVVLALLLCFGPIVLVGWLVYRAARSKGSTPAMTRTSRQKTFDECPKRIFCFHKDKGEHHVRRGKEIDPWDRPDIDISKYQRQR